MPENVYLTKKMKLGRVILQSRIDESFTKCFEDDAGVTNSSLEVEFCSLRRKETVTLKTARMSKVGDEYSERYSQGRTESRPAKIAKRRLSFACDDEDKESIITEDEEPEAVRQTVESILTEKNEDDEKMYQLKIIEIPLCSYMIPACNVMLRKAPAPSHLMPPPMVVPKPIKKN